MAAAAAPLVAAAGLQLVQRISAQTLTRTGSIAPIWCMSYNSERDELFLVEFMEHFSNSLRAISLRRNSGDLRDVFTRTERGTTPHVYSVCHMSDSDSLLVCYSELCYSCAIESNWLVALSRRGNEWRETPRVQTGGMGHMCCALADSRVLVGELNSTYLEMFRVTYLESGPRIAHVHRIRVPEEYSRFTAKICNNEALIAMSFLESQTIRVHRLDGDQLVELSRIHVNNQPCDVLWLADRLLVTDWIQWNADKQSHSVLELNWRDGQLERSRELIQYSDSINVWCWCAVDNGLAIYDENNKELVHYNLA